MINLRNAFQTSRRHHADRRILREMDDYMLADLGLTRRDITAMVDGETQTPFRPRF